MTPSADSLADAQKAQLMATHFALLVYASRMGRQAEAAKHAKALFALGVIVQLTPWSPADARCRDE